MINDNYTSTGAKFFAHQEVMNNLRNGKGQPIVTHVMLTDICNHTCAFCSVAARGGDSLNYLDVMEYLDILIKYGLKAVILSGGGNPILYKCKHTGCNFNDVVRNCRLRGLEVGLITNGMPLVTYKSLDTYNYIGRQSWKSVFPETLDMLTWVRISMSGLDHPENEVYVPDIDPEKTALGFSYVAHDVYNEPEDPHHGKVSRQLDLISGNRGRPADKYFEERVEELTIRFIEYVTKHKPRYLRLLPNCLEPDLIPLRVQQLEKVCKQINFSVNREVAFVQNKPPKAPKACYLGYIHPVLNCDGYVYPCDSCVLNEAAGHQFANPWRICKWNEIGKIYEQPVKSLIEDPGKTCPGCVFSRSNELLQLVVDGRGDLPVPHERPYHLNFV